MCLKVDIITEILSRKSTEPHFLDTILNTFDCINHSKSSQLTMLISRNKNYSIKLILLVKIRFFKYHRDCLIIQGDTMDCGRVVNTTGLVTVGTYCAIWGVEAAAAVPAIVLIKTGAILFSLACLIGIVTQQLFERFGWTNRPGSLLVGAVITWIYSFKLTSAIIIGSGLAVSSGPVWTVCLIALFWLASITNFTLAVRNICYRENHAAFH